MKLITNTQEGEEYNEKATDLKKAAKKVREPMKGDKSRNSDCKSADTSSESDSSKADEKPKDDVFIEKVEKIWEKAARDDKDAKSKSSSGKDSKSDGTISKKVDDATFNKADKAEYKAADEPSKKERKAKKDDHNALDSVLE